MTLSILLSLIFFILGCIHFYWTAGGKWGINNALPTNTAGKKLIQPSTLSTIIVGMGLTAFGVFYLLPYIFTTAHLPEWISNFGYILIPTLFLLRAIGDFKHVGFFKKLTNTAFAKWDTRLFTPLCLLIAALGIMIALTR